MMVRSLGITNEAHGKKYCPTLYCTISLDLVGELIRNQVTQLYNEMKIVSSWIWPVCD